MGWLEVAPGPGMGQARSLTGQAYLDSGALNGIDRLHQRLNWVFILAPPANGSWCHVLMASFLHGSRLLDQPVIFHKDRIVKVQLSPAPVISPTATAEGMHTNIQTTGRF